MSNFIKIGLAALAITNTLLTGSIYSEEITSTEQSIVIPEKLDKQNLSIYARKLLIELPESSHKAILALKNAIKNKKIKPKTRQALVETQLELLSKLLILHKNVSGILNNHSDEVELCLITKEFIQYMDYAEDILTQTSFYVLHPKKFGQEKEIKLNDSLHKLNFQHQRLTSLYSDLQNEGKIE